MSTTFYRDGKGGLHVAAIDAEPPCTTGDPDGIEISWGRPHSWAGMGKFARCARCGLIRHEAPRSEIIKR